MAIDRLRFAVAILWLSLALALGITLTTLTFAILVLGLLLLLLEQQLIVVLKTLVWQNTLITWENSIDPAISFPVLELVTIESKSVTQEVVNHHVGCDICQLLVHVTHTATVFKVNVAAFMRQDKSLHVKITFGPKLGVDLELNTLSALAVKGYTCRRDFLVFNE